MNSDSYKTGVAVLHVPAQDHLRSGLTVRGGDPGDRLVGNDALQMRGLQ
jgi:hypothetical protein